MNKIWKKRETDSNQGLPLSYVLIDDREMRK